MIDSWTIAKGLLLYTGIVVALFSALFVLWWMLSLIRAAIYIEDRRAEKDRADAEERARAKAQAEATERCRQAYEKSPIGKVARDTEHPL